MNRQNEYYYVYFLLAHRSYYWKAIYHFLIQKRSSSYVFCSIVARAIFQYLESVRYVTRKLKSTKQVAGKTQEIIHVSLDSATLHLI